MEVLSCKMFFEQKNKKVAEFKVWVIWWMDQNFSSALWFESLYEFEHCHKVSRYSLSAFCYFCLNCLSKTLQSLAICSSSNYVIGSHKVNQSEECLVSPKNKSFFLLKLNFWISWLLENVYSTIALIAAWIQVFNDKPISRHQSQCDWITLHLLLIHMWRSQVQNLSFFFCVFLLTF